MAELFYGFINLRNKNKSLFKVLEYILIVFIIAAIFNILFYSPVRVIGNSMNPALDDRDIVIVDKIIYDFFEPERFDLIVFPYKYNNNTNYIKRVIGLPGETIEIINNEIYINGSILDESYGINDKTKNPQYPNMKPVELGSDEYFVLGDNRDNSDDSRSDSVGIIKKQDIIGKAIIRIWPFNSIGTLKYQ